MNIAGGPPQFIRATRPQWQGNQAMPQRQVLHLDPQTHAHIQSLDPVARAEYFSKLHKRNMLVRQQVDNSKTLPSERFLTLVCPFCVSTDSILIASHTIRQILFNRTICRLAAKYVRPDKTSSCVDKCLVAKCNGSSRHRCVPIISHIATLLLLLWKRHSVFSCCFFSVKQAAGRTAHGATETSTCSRAKSHISRYHLKFSSHSQSEKCFKTIDSIFALNFRLGHLAPGNMPPQQSPVQQQQFDVNPAAQLQFAQLQPGMKPLPQASNAFPDIVDSNSNVGVLVRKRELIFATNKHEHSLFSQWNFSQCNHHRSVEWCSNHQTPKCQIKWTKRRLRWQICLVID